MRTLISCILFCSTAVYAQSTHLFDAEKPVVCGDAKRILAEITSEKWNEQMQWAGYERSSDSYYVMFSNKDTTSWTLLQTNGEQACIMGTGDKSLTPN